VPDVSVVKSALKDELVRKLAANLETQERAYRVAKEGATHEESKPENDKDTRALEQSYLARGQAMRIDELRAAVAEVSALGLRARGPVALGALVTIDEDGRQTSVFLAPHGGGERLAEGAVQVVTPQSPLGRALLGKREGDDVEALLAGRTRELTIVRVE
jgi:transcription elongation GreA/GreB family factor